MNTDEQAPAPTTPLLWSTGGRIACRAHLPEPGSAGWWAARWHRMGADEQAGYARAAGHPPRCEACEALEELARIDGEGR